MEKNYAEYWKLLNEIISLLENYNESHWADYFMKSKHYFLAGYPQKSIFYTLGAYGGMCSFSDSLSFTGAPKEIYERYLVLREEMYLCAGENRSFLLRFLEFFRPLKEKRV